MAEDKSVRVVVKISPSRHPELFEALEEIDSSGRAERLRSLALFALSGCSTSAESIQSDSRFRKSEKATPKAGSKVQTKGGDPAVKKIASEPNHDKESADKTPLETEEDPHKEVRASVLKGIKSVGF